MWALLIRLRRLLLSSQGSSGLVCFFCFCGWESVRCRWELRWGKRLVDQDDSKLTDFRCVILQLQFKAVWFFELGFELASGVLLSEDFSCSEIEHRGGDRSSCF
jgi:hypothetical protein